MGAGCLRIPGPYADPEGGSVEILVMGGWTAFVAFVAAHTALEYRRRQVRRLRQELWRSQEVADVLKQVSYEQAAEIAGLKILMEAK